MKTILVPIDFSPVTPAVIRAACGFAKLTRGRLILLHVVQLPVAMDPYGLSSAFVSEAFVASEKAASRQLRTWRQRCLKQVASVRTVQRLGDPAAEVLTLIRTLKPAYVIIGSHGHRALYDLLMGSTTQGVLRRATCPVLVVPDVPRAATRRGKR